MLYKKDFKRIAEIIKSNTVMAEDVVCKQDYPQYHLATQDTRLSIAVDFAGYLATQNPRFDRQKFLDACGLK